LHLCKVNGTTLSKPSFNKNFTQVSNENFEAYCLELFRFQYEHVAIYQAYCKAINRTPEHVRQLADIPFLPISFFKTHEVLCEGHEAAVTFTSSGTGGERSKHPVSDLNLYIQSFRLAFERLYGPIGNYHLLALLPNYLERQGSSLVFMAEDFMKQARAESGFFLHNFQELSDTLDKLEARGEPALLLGVSFALLDFSAAFPKQLKHTVVMETGGMKGTREEMSRAALHHQLQAQLGVQHIHSEYGMTELLSQAYSKGQGLFMAPPWMRIVIRQVQDPFCLLGHQRRGAVNIIDLANTYSCAFIETQDLGISHSDEWFEITGRVDLSEVRGCNLLFSES